MKAPATRGRRTGSMLSAAMTPMIDVVFLLLVFFLVTATFDEPEQNLAASLIVQPLEAGAGAATADTPPPPDDVKLVGGHAGGVTTWTLNGGRSTADPAELTALLGQLAQIDAALPVTIDAGPNVPLADVVTAYDAARGAGFARVLLAASADALQRGDTP